MISDCQQLYPDSELNSDSDEEISDGYFTTASGLHHLSLEGEAVLNHLESIIQNEDNGTVIQGRFRLLTY